ncbi:MAG TPA: ABC transporter substrate-binding protein [Stellaceae bacterium]|nr:ABC transporter substrate-binding protein [Stellaceae bacterium]
MSTSLSLDTVVGPGAWRDGLARVQGDQQEFALNFIEVEPIHRAFAPMAREQKFAVSEMAIITALQALAYDKPLLLLPVTLAARFQHGCLITRRSAPVMVGDLRGRRVGVRAYTQTTGVWLRGILQNDYGVSPDSIRWLIQEGAHLAEYRDPAWVEPAPPGRSLPDLLREGAIDAAILGNDLPDDPDFVPVIPDPDQAAHDWYAKHGVVPINHMMVVRRDVAVAHPRAMRELWRILRRAKPAAKDGIDKAAIGVAANRRALDMIVACCAQQSLLPRALSLDDIFSQTATIFGIDVAS